MPFEDQSREWIAKNHGAVILTTPARIGSDTILTLITCDSVLADPIMHPERFASRLSSAQIATRGRAVPYVQNNLQNGNPWWDSALKDSAGVAAAARCLVFGLMWSRDPERAAYEAALSSSVTHGHPSAICSASIFAAALHNSFTAFIETSKFDFSLFSSSISKIFSTPFFPIITGTPAYISL